MSEKDDKKADVLAELDFPVLCGAVDAETSEPTCSRKATHILTLSCTADCTWERMPLPVCSKHFLHWSDGVMTCKGHTGPLGRDYVLKKAWSAL